MERQLVIDEDGVWITNSGMFPFTDPTTMVRYEPGTRVKACPTDWVMAQAVMQFDGKEEAIAAKLADKLMSAEDKAAAKVAYEAAEAAARAAKELAEAEARALESAKTKTTK